MILVIVSKEYEFPVTNGQEVNDVEYEESQVFYIEGSFYKTVVKIKKLVKKSLTSFLKTLVVQHLTLI